MANIIEELSEQARKLPAADRVRLAEELLATVHEPDDEVEAVESPISTLVRPSLFPLKKCLRMFDVW